MSLRNQKPNWKYSVEVENWQKDLVSVGYSVDIDGYFGDETESETRKFQRDMRIRVDGIVGPETSKAMDILKSRIIVVYRRGSRGNMVRWIQEQYLSRGYSLEIDGSFGPETERVTKEFQKDMNIEVDGIVGPITLGKLREPQGMTVRKIKVYIDNGHEPSNVNGGTQGYKEWEGNLKSARYLKEILSNIEKFEIMMTYDWDIDANVRQRGNKAANWGAQLLFSIHSNAGKGSGTECYYSIDIPTDKKYASLICERVSKEFGIPNRGAKIKQSLTTEGEDFMGIIDSAQDGGVDHVLLVESMFHDNNDEEKLLLKDDTHKRLAEIYAGVILEIFP